MATRIQVRRDTAANWRTSGATTLAAGEIGFETDTLLFKIGDGSQTWTDLEYAGGTEPIQYNPSGTSVTDLDAAALRNNGNGKYLILGAGSVTNGPSGLNTGTDGQLMVTVAKFDYTGASGSGNERFLMTLQTLTTGRFFYRTYNGSWSSWYEAIRADPATGNVTIAGDLAVNGGDITTNQTTASVFNATATTLNVGQAATTVSIGAATGTTTINNATTAITGAATVGGTLAVTGNTTLTGDLAVNGGDITTTSATATLVNATATTVNIGGAATAVALGASAGTVSVGNLSMNAGYGSIAPVYGCRAWVNFNGLASAITTTFPGGLTATVSRTGGSTTATITTSAAHGLLTGHYVATTAAAPVIDSAPASYQVTVTSTTTFTVTTSATSALSAVSITFNWQTIRASGGIHSISRHATGNYTVNFITAMPDANYAAVISGNGTGSVNITVGGARTSLVGSCTIDVGSSGTGSSIPSDRDIVSVAIFR